MCYPSPVYRQQHHFILLAWDITLFFSQGTGASNEAEGCCKTKPPTAGLPAYLGKYILCKLPAMEQTLGIYDGHREDTHNLKYVLFPIPPLSRL